MPIHKWHFSPCQKTQATLPPFPSFLASLPPTSNWSAPMHGKENRNAWAASLSVSSRHCTAKANSLSPGSAGGRGCKSTGPLRKRALLGSLPCSDLSAKPSLTDSRTGLALLRGHRRPALIFSCTSLEVFFTSRAPSFIEKLTPAESPSRAPWRLLRGPGACPGCRGHAPSRAPPPPLGAPVCF